MAMLRFLKGLLLSFGVLFLVLIVGAAIGLRYAANQWQPEPLPEHVVLSLTLEPELRETSGIFSLENVFEGGEPSILDIVNTLKVASEDERVKGLFLDFSFAQVRPAEAQELRAALARFRASGRFVHAYADSVEGDGGISAYHLATGAENIALQPSGLLDIRGISLTSPFFGGALKKLGIEADFRTRHEYKGATSSITNERFPSPIRRNYRRLVDSLYAGIAADIATARRLSPSSVNGLIDTAPLTSSEAKSNGLIDQMLYRDEAADAARAKADGAALVPFARYRDEAEPDDIATRIAVIAVEGPIIRGQTSLFDRDHQAAAQNIVEAVEAAQDDERVKAIILRISSPGGSYVASDTILHSLSSARSGGLPVIVSMSGMAASGGYFIALAADHVVAHPNTITGSIGVVSGKLNLSGFLADYGVTVDSITAGQNADMFSMTRPFSEAEGARLNAVLNAIYEDFTTKVATARRLDPVEIDTAARGRVWSGKDAKRIGLVDVLGGYAEAEGLARDAAGISPETRTALVSYPEQAEGLEAFVNVIEGGEIGATASRLDMLLALVRYSRFFEAVLNGSGGDLMEAIIHPVSVR